MNRERIYYLFDRHADGSLTAEEKQELEVYLLNSPEVRGWFWDHARLSTLLREACQLDAGREMAEVDTTTEQAAVTTAISASAAAPTLPMEPSSQQTIEPGRATNQSLGFIGDILAGGMFNVNPLKMFALVVVAMLVGSGLTFWLMGSGNGGQNHSPSIVQSLAQSSDDDGGSSSSAPMATLVNVTNCRWDPTRSTADVLGGTVRPGQSLSLLEGVAEVNTALPNGGLGRFLLEGPLSMILTSEGMPNFQYGKLTAEISCGFKRYTLDTPVGRIIVPYEASIGLIANANDLELHVFSGEAVFEPLWRIDDNDPNDFGNANERLVVGSGAFIRLQADSDRDIHHGKANRALFATQVSMAANELDIPSQYVAAIRKAGPFGYWRFEGVDENLVRNEMGDRLHCRVMGDGVRWRTYPSNRSIEFGSTTEAGYLVSEDAVDGMIENDYTLEMWIKPSHLHHGAVFSLVEEPARPTQSVGSGLLLELRGPSYAWQPLYSKYPGRLRYLHRSVPRVFDGGTSAYSKSPYESRRWQYVVAEKEGATMRLYLDGQLVARGEDSTTLPGGLRVLFGQLYPLYHPGVAITRPFMGELDEVALYNRALSEQELMEHYQLARVLPETPAAASDENREAGQEETPKAILKFLGRDK